MSSLPSSRRSPLLREVADEFLISKRALRDKTYASYFGWLIGAPVTTKRPLGLPLCVYFHGRKIGTLAAPEIHSWFAQRVNGGAQHTKARIARSARQFFSYAHAYGHTITNLGVGIPSIPAGESRKEWLDWGEVHALLDSIPELHLRFGVSWLFYTGCRVSEATVAVQRDVRLSKEIGLYLWTIPDSKTHRARTVYLPSELATHVETTRALNAPGPDWPLLWDSEGRGFARSLNPRYPISARSLANAMERARDACGLTVSITPHVAKHTYCSNWIREYGDGEHAMEKLSRQVGTSVEVLRRTYVHVRLADSDFDQIRAFGAR